jgi:hypothetical protein
MFDQGQVAKRPPLLEYVRENFEGDDTFGDYEVLQRSATAAAATRSEAVQSASQVPPTAAQ